MFRVKNDTFTKQLRIAVREDKTTQDILQEISLRDIKEFTKKNEFLLFQERIYMPTKLWAKIITKQYNLPIHRYQGRQKILEKIS